MHWGHATSPDLVHWKEHGDVLAPDTLAYSTDGRTFTKYSDTPDGKRIQIGWIQAPSPGMPFNQLQSLPSELALKATPQGPRQVRTPVKTLQSLREGGDQAKHLPNPTDSSTPCAESVLFLIPKANC